MTFREIERLVKKDGWFLFAVSGSHYQYLHNEKKGKVTILRLNIMEILTKELSTPY